MVHEPGPLDDFDAEDDGDFAKNLKRGSPGKVVRRGQIVEINETSEKKFRERVFFLELHEGTRVTPRLLFVDEEQMCVLEAYIPCTPLEQLKRKKLSASYCKKLIACLEEVFASVKGDFADFSNLNNFGVVEEAGEPARVVIFEGGRHLGAPLAVEDFVRRVISHFGTRLEKGKYRV